MNKRNIIFPFVLCLCFKLITSQPAGWDGSISIELSTDVGRANITSDIVNFPTLIRIDNNDFDFSLTKANGDDVRFTDANDNLLPFEIEKWDSTNGSAVVWVLVDTLKATSIKNIKMYYGNSSATAASNSAAVFEVANGFTSVWHLGEDGNISPNGYSDATSNNNHGTGVNLTSNSDVTGNIGSGQEFDGVDDYITIAANSSIGNLTNTLTVSGWIYKDSLVGLDRFFSASRATTNNGFGVGTNGTGARFTTYGVRDYDATDMILTVDTWYHFVAVMDGSNVTTFYINGDQVIEIENHTAPGNINLDDSWEIGTLLNPGLTENFDGIIDEVRVSSVTRSADWINLTYENQKTNQTLVNILDTNIASCTNAFGVSKTTVNLSERASDTLVGTSICALQASEWLNQDSSRIQTGDQYIISSTRVGADTSFEVIFKAVFDTGVSYQNVTINITKTIPDPIPSITDPTGSWTGQAPLPIQSVITNAAAVSASPDPTVTYLWTSLGTSIPVTLSGANTSTVTLSTPTQNGNVDMELCVNNGGLVLCDTTQVVVAPPVNPIPVIIHPTDTMNGTRTLIIQSTLQNAAEIANSPDSIVSYEWAKVGTFEVTLQNVQTPSLSLLWPLVDGSYQIELCVHNGRTPICDTTQVVVKLLVGVGDRIGPLEPLRINNGSLIWNRPARIKIWTMDGKILLDRSGKLGDTFKLPESIQHAIQMRTITSEITEL